MGSILERSFPSFFGDMAAGKVVGMVGFFLELPAHNVRSSEFLELPMSRTSHFISF